MPNLIERISGLLAQATPEPWEWSGDLDENLLVAHGHFQAWGDGFPGFETDKQLIAELRNAAPALMDALKESENALRQLQWCHDLIHRIKCDPNVCEVQAVIEALRSKLAALESEQAGREQS